LSGGEQQRVAVARALAHRPKIVFADEPTGNLDPLTAQQVLDALVSACRGEGAALLMVTHSQSAADRLDRSIVLHPHGLRAAAARGSVAASPQA
jgi:putative ABC transport system ATP-binding protein